MKIIYLFNNDLFMCVDKTYYIKGSYEISDRCLTYIKILREDIVSYL